MQIQNVIDLLKTGKQFSFLLGDQNAWDTPFQEEVSVDGNIRTGIYRFEDGLVVTNITRLFPEFGAVEWVNYFENTSDRPTPIISQLWDCDCVLPLGNEQAADSTSSVASPIEAATKIYAPFGSTWSPYEFYCDVDELEDRARHNHIQPGETKT